MNPFLIEDELKMKSHIFHIFIQAPVLIFLFFYFHPVTSNFFPSWLPVSLEFTF